MPHHLPVTVAGNGKQAWASITAVYVEGALDSCMLITEMFIFSQDLPHRRLKVMSRVTARDWCLAWCSICNRINTEIKVALCPLQLQVRKLRHQKQKHLSQELTDLKSSQMQFSC